MPVGTSRSQPSFEKTYILKIFIFREISIMKRLLWYACCCWTLSLVGAAASHASPGGTTTEDTTTNGTAANLGRIGNTDNTDNSFLPIAGAIFDGSIAQVPPPPSPPEVPANPSTPVPPTTSPAPSNGETQDLQNQLNQINNQPAPDKFNTYIPKVSPGFSISNPTGFGADNNLFFFGLSYQNRTRFTQTSDGEAGFGVGLGDAVKSVGVELSYSINSFGSSAAFGSGAFNAKVHKRISEDTAVAIGWNQFAQINLGSGRNGNFASDYPKNSYYAVGSKIFRTCEDINQPLCRVAVTAGVGSGVFLPFNTISDAVAQGTDPSGINVFGSVGVRVARPVSAILEWTGQDLAAGVSIAPFDNFPLVITPAVRDITGAGDGARFILGAGVALNF
jgi:hypothetical protein